MTKKLLLLSMLICPSIYAKSKCKSAHSCCDSETSHCGKKSLKHSKKRKSKLINKEELHQLADMGEVYEPRADVREAFESRMDFVLPVMTDTELYPRERYGSAGELLAESEEVQREAPTNYGRRIVMPSEIYREYEEPYEPQVQSGRIENQGDYYHGRTYRQGYTTPGEHESK